VTVEALAYFEGGDLDSLDAATCALLVAESVRELDTCAPHPFCAARRLTLTSPRDVFRALDRFFYWLVL
jgi:hypothetical protein